MTEYLILSAAEAEALCPGLQPLITHRIGDAGSSDPAVSAEGGLVCPAAVLSDAAHVSKKAIWRSTAGDWCQRRMAGEQRSLAPPRKNIEVPLQVLDLRDRAIVCGLKLGLKIAKERYVVDALEAALKRDKCGLEPGQLGRDRSIG